MQIPKLLRWFDRHNEGKSYREQVKPFGFLLVYQTGSASFAGDYFPRPVSPYDGDLGKAVFCCFDRETGELVPQEQLRSYRDALAQYHLHPESKFHNGDCTDRGVTRRRHVRATVTEYIGKEANRWEEQIHLGLDLEAQTEYGTAPDDHDRILEIVRCAGKKFGQRKVASAAEASLSMVSAILSGKRGPTPATLAKLYRALPRLEQESSKEAASAREVLEAIKERCQAIGVRRFAKQDAANLTKVLSGRRMLSETMRTKLEVALVGSEAIDTAFDQ